MPAERSIRADYDRDTIVVYQPYSQAIADAALAAGRFAVRSAFWRCGSSVRGGSGLYRSRSSRRSSPAHTPRPTTGPGSFQWRQVGLSRHVIREYVDDWVVGIDDYTPRVRKIYALLQSGQADKARRQLPPEWLYAVSAEIGQRRAGEEVARRFQVARHGSR